MTPADKAVTIKAQRDGAVWALRLAAQGIQTLTADAAQDDNPPPPAALEQSCLNAEWLLEVADRIAKTDQLLVKETT